MTSFKLRKWIKISAFLTLAISITACVSTPTSKMESDRSLLIKNAEAGNSQAQYELALVYYRGKGVPINLSKAAKWFIKSAELGNTAAQNNIGYMYEHGEGVPQDYTKAFYWYEKASQQGFATAQQNLGRLYELGRGVKANDDAALKLYQLSANQGNEGSKKLLENLKSKQKNSSDNSVSNHLDKDQSLNNDHIAELTKYANLSFSIAQFELGKIYEDEGVKLASDNKMSEANEYYKKAIYWYEKAIEQRHPTAMSNLGMMYSNGQGLEKDKKKAVALFKDSANAGDASGQNRLGLFYESGWGGLKQDKKKALYWFQKAADQGFDQGKFNVYRLTELNKPSKKLVVNSQSKYPAAPAHQKGVITCRTNCWNGDCYRTYSDGTKKHFQAPRRYNPMSGQFEWDSGGC